MSIKIAKGRPVGIKRSLVKSVTKQSPLLWT